ncbi:MAG: 2-oxo acid dehydrogenase subunit E2, partial [Simkania negevensis]|nr:2-oxo acid dehydrogenase subunit E2 [Simkania negevensis]
MNEEIEIKLPKLGESIVSATIVQWFKKEGDEIKLDEPLLEVSTDKVNSEIPSPVSGVIKKIVAFPDEELEVGAPLACIATGENVLREEERPSSTVVEKGSTSSMRGVFSPVVLKIAEEKGISIEELEKIPATGTGGRLSKRDLENYLNREKTPSASKEIDSSIERMKMTGIRKKIAENMVRSFYEAPHASLIQEVDMTYVMKKLEKEKEAFLKEKGFKLTVTSFIAKAIAKGLQQYPLLNSSLEDDTILLKRFVNLGIAVSVDQGILVPVIQNCQSRSIEEIAKEVALLSTKAREGTLSPDQVKEGTITMTNFGMSGALIGIPIIRYP